MRVIVAQEPWNDRIGILIETVRGEMGRAVLKFPQPEQIIVHEGDRVEPSFELRRDELQALVDALVAFGITPTVPPAQASELAAIKYHLEDMRRLAFWSVAQ